MFTNAKTELNSLAKCAQFDPVRNAEISYAGKIPTHLNARVVPAATPNHIDQAVKLSKLGSTIAAMIVPAELAGSVPEHFGLGIAPIPLQAVARIQELLARRNGFQWESYKSRVHPDAHVAVGAYIAPEDVTIGAGCTIGSNVSIFPRTVIGQNCHIGANTVLGMEAFDQMPGSNPRRLMKQSGGVHLKDNITIAANCSISRATFGGFASIGSGTLIDANVYIAHDAQIGRDVTICSGVSISGRVSLCNNCYIGPQAAISNGITIGTGATVSIGAVVTRSVDPGSRVTGNFALPHDQWLTLIRNYRAS